MTRTITYTWSPGPLVSWGLVAGIAALSSYLYLRPAFRPRKVRPPAPRPAGVLTAADGNHPYPLDVMPGGRTVATAYGAMRIFEWGPEHGERVLFLHGIGTPCLALGDLADDFVGKGCRVMLFGEFVSFLGGQQTSNT